MTKKKARYNTRFNAKCFGTLSRYLHNKNRYREKEEVELTTVEEAAQCLVM